MKAAIQGAAKSDADCSPARHAAVEQRQQDTTTESERLGFSGFRSPTVWRLRHLATVFVSLPNARLSVASEACDRGIAAAMARVLVALP
ncbi:hypothetical protein GOB93_19810 [Acetobacter musti]|uniref:Uncharacterized protein n=1 Tax=Acetobacter musti TaxID=864732 RepID=A0ABX0JTK3_9PROT|nr:hypothetical protein [Acetobacter musti]NHN86828.1 hypothetical protein [Acetobacter musti]